MADQKITELTENTTPLGTDLLALVDDPAGSPATQKIKISNVLATPDDGWKNPLITPTYNAINKMNVPSGAALVYQKGDKIRFQNNDSGTWLYNYVIAIADTVLTLAVSNVPNAVLTDFYYSHQTSPIGFPTYFVYTPAITWIAGTAPSGSPVRKEFFWIEGSVCHVRVNDYGWTAGVTVTGANVALPFEIATQYQLAIGMISLTDTIPPDPGYNYVRNADIQLLCTSVAATFIAFSADYYY